jgi:rhodanese-related sulfurtransferase
MLPPADSLEIGVEETAQLLGDDSEDAIRLIDCREEDEFALCRIPGAELMPLSRFPEEAGNRLLSNQARPVVVYCHHGMRSLQAANYLRQLGHDQVWSMSGGINAWSLEIDPEVPRY